MIPFILLTVVLLAADVPRVARLLPPNPREVVIPAGEAIPVLPDFSPATKLPDKDPKPSERAERLRPESRLAIIRFVAGEFARAVKPLPTGKNGLRISPGQSEVPDQPKQAANSPGTIILAAPKAANPGDLVQVTAVEFRDQQIVLQINGGGSRKKSWRERISMSVGGMPTISSSSAQTSPGYEQVGSTLILDFGKPVPDVTPDELKQMVAGYLDFSKQRSASVHWIETLPEEFQKAIKEKRAVVGMDREMVRAAIGQPDKKIREKDADGRETEDWIYGRPPSQTIFVKFAGEKVISVVQYP